MARRSKISRAPANPTPGQTDGQEPEKTNTEGENGPGKPVGTPNLPSDLAGQAGGEAGTGGDTASGASNTEGANDAGDTAEALLQAPGGPQGSAPGQGGEAEILPATNDARVPQFDLAAGAGAFQTYEGLERLALVDAVGNVLSPAAGATGDGGPADAPENAPAMITVICHATDGRRRLGRRWPEGETPIPVGELSDTEIAILRGDPRFTVILPT